MQRWIYVSSENYRFTSGELASLLEKSRAANERIGVTGFLLYKDGEFMQAIEGPEAVVRELAARIERDPRHCRMTTVFMDEVAEPLFPEWPMGFRSLHDPLLLKIHRLSEIRKLRLKSRAYVENPKAAQDLLQTLAAETMAKEPVRAPQFSI